MPATAATIICVQIFVVIFISFVTMTYFASTAAAQNIAAVADENFQLQVPATDANINRNEGSPLITQRKIPYLLRLHLIRHGETRANVDNLVLGQGDSPLTERGLLSARSAASSGRVNGRGAGEGDVRYWRAYCSDLRRAQLTAMIALGLHGGTDNGDDSSSLLTALEDGVGVDDLVPDARLRELAKGAKEGWPKSLTYAEALNARREERSANAQNQSIPILETNEEAWNRVSDWLDFVLEDASLENQQSNELGTQGTKGEKFPRIYDVFALSHSALIRMMIHKMVNDQLPPDYAKTSAEVLSIPNLSRTIIDLRSHVSASETCIDENGNAKPMSEELTNGNHAAVESGNRTPKWTATLVQLTDISHLQQQQSTANNSGPPYL